MPNKIIAALLILPLSSVKRSLASNSAALNPSTSAILPAFSDAAINNCKLLSSKASDYKQYLSFGFNLLQNVDRVYVSGNPHLKNQILCSMYAEKWIFEGEEYRTPTYHPELALILNAVKGFGPNKKGQSQNGLTLSSMVVPPRIELGSKV